MSFKGGVSRIAATSIATSLPAAPIITFATVSKPFEAVFEARFAHLDVYEDYRQPFLCTFVLILYPTTFRRMRMIHQRPALRAPHQCTPTGKPLDARKESMDCRGLQMLGRDAHMAKTSSIVTNSQQTVCPPSLSCLVFPTLLPSPSPLWTPLPFSDSGRLATRTLAPRFTRTPFLVLFTRVPAND